MRLDARPATLADTAAIAAIYNQGIEDRVATFETAPRTPEQIAGWFDSGPPVVVAVASDAVVGFAAAFPYADRCCYAGVAEFSVYTRRDWRGRGVGQLVLGALVDAARAQGLWKLLSRIFPENHASRSLVARLGFDEIGLHRKHGKLDGQWRDCVIVEKLLVDDID